MRFWIGFGIVYGLMAIAAIVGLVGGAAPVVWFIAISTVVTLPFSLVILIISMMLSSKIVGGIDFGSVSTAIPKSIALLVLVNVLGNFPCVGWLMTLPVWALGLMALFNLELWEARVLIGINWLMNVAVRFMCIGAMVAAMVGGSKFHMPSFGKGSGAVAFGPKAVDKYCEEKLPKRTTDNIRGWVGQGKTVLSLSPGQSKELADRLFNAGAQRVLIANLSINQVGGGRNAITVIIQLPDDKEKRAAIIAIRNEYAEQLGEISVSEAGQKFLILGYDDD
jgi:hypothetical protein